MRSGRVGTNTGVLAVDRYFRNSLSRAQSRRKYEENPNVVEPAALSTRTVSAWERVIRDQPVRYLTERFVIDDGISIRWAPRIWSQWEPGLQCEIRNGAFDRLVRYFTRSVPGGC